MAALMEVASESDEVKMTVSRKGKLSRRVKEILSWYESDSPGTKANIARMLMQGRLGGTGRLVILPVDQGFEHGPARSFADNPEAYDPHYHFKLAIDAGLNAYAAPLGMLEAGADTFAGEIPLILKVNSANSLAPKAVGGNQAVTGSVKDALRLGCSAIGLTIYPGAEHAYDMFEEAREMIAEAKSYGLAAVVWSYARGPEISKDGETGIDVIAYAAHMAALLGAHFIKVKPPTAHIEQAEAKKVYEKNKIDVSSLEKRIAHVVQCCFSGRRVVIFSGGNAKGNEDIYKEISQIAAGGGFGSIIGRNTFQRPKPQALSMLDEIVKIYKNA